MWINLKNISVKSLLKPDLINIILNNTTLKLKVWNKNKKIKLLEIDKMSINTSSMDILNLNVETNYHNKFIWGDIILDNKNLYETYLYAYKYSTNQQDYINFFELISKYNYFNMIILDEDWYLVYLPDYDKYWIFSNEFWIDILFNVDSAQDLLTKNLETYISLEKDSNWYLVDEDKWYYSINDLSLRLILTKNYCFKNILVNWKKVEIFEYYKNSYTVWINSNWDFIIKDYFWKEYYILNKKYENLEIHYLSKNNLTANKLEWHIVLYNNITKKIISEYNSDSFTLLDYILFYPFIKD